MKEKSVSVILLAGGKGKRMGVSLSFRFQIHHVTLIIYFGLSSTSIAYVIYQSTQSHDITTHTQETKERRCFLVMLVCFTHTAKTTKKEKFHKNNGS